MQDVRMIQRAGGLCFDGESAKPVFVPGESGAEDFDCDLTGQPCVRGAVDLAHAAGSEQRHDFVRTKSRSDSQGHQE
jgi:hypothetical protein